MPISGKLDAHPQHIYLLLGAKSQQTRTEFIVLLAVVNCQKVSVKGASRPGGLKSMGSTVISVYGN